MNDLKNLQSYDEKSLYRGECWRQESCANNMLKKYDKKTIYEDYNINIDIIGKGLSKIKDLSKIKAIDLGCGNAQYLSYYMKCVGVDLPFVISNYSKKVKKMRFIKCDVTKSKLWFLKKYDLVLISGLLTVMKEPLIILDKVLKNSNNYVLVHRNQLTSEPTITKKNLAYGGWTYETTINFDDFNYLLKAHNFEIIYEEKIIIKNRIDSYSHLIKKL